MADVTGSAMSTKMEQDLLSRWLKNTTTILGAAPSTVYVALGTAGSDTGLTEVAGNNYSRPTIGFSATTGTQPCYVTGPTATCNFPQASGSWGTITHFGIFDASTTGNMLFWGSLTASVSIATNDTFQFATNAITINAG